MSHDKRHHPVSGQSTTTPIFQSEEHVGPLSSSSTTSSSISAPASSSTSPSSYPTSEVPANPASSQPPVALLDMSNSGKLTRLEGWAVHASDSQFNALSGAIGGFTSGIVTCPLDVIKTKLQAQGGFAAIQKGRHVGHPKVYQGLVGTAKVIWREEGLRGMYRGLGPIILGYLPTWAVWFTVYNKSKVIMSQYQENTFVINFYSSIIAGASSTIVTNPIWVIKTRLMSQTAQHRAPLSVWPKSSNTPTSRPTMHAPWHYQSTIDAARKMYTTEGVLSFYSGLTPALLGLTHVAVQFPAYEFLKTKFTGQGMGGLPENADEQAHWLGILSASILSKMLASSATYPHEVIRTRLQTQRRPTPGHEYLENLGTQTVPAAESTGGTSGSTPHASQSRLQPPQMRRYKGVISTFRSILREEGWRAFYAGMGTNMMRAVPAATVTMCTYEYIMRQLKTARSVGRHKLEETNPGITFPG